MHKIRSRWEIIKSYIGGEDYIAASLILMGILGYFEGPIPYIPHLTDFYIDIRSELIGIGLTVLIIDNINEIYRRRAEKERLILQMGSPDNGFALEAVRQLAQKRWLYDGSLRGAILEHANLGRAILIRAYLGGANLYDANLEEAVLKEVNLKRAILYVANLKLANLEGANLEEANLTRANLKQAYLGGANLKGAILIGAHLEGANLNGANLREASFDWLISGGEPTWKDHLTASKSLEGATMPDGKIFDPAIHELLKPE